MARTAGGDEAILSVGSFNVGKVRLLDGNGTFQRVLEAPLTGGGARAPDTLNYASGVDLGVLEPHKTVVVVFTGSFWLPTYSQLAGGPPTLRFRHLAASSDTYASSGAVAPGNRLHFAIHLDNAGFRPAQGINLRVKITPRSPAKSVRVSWGYTSDNSGHDAKVATAVVNAEGRPISLSVIRERRCSGHQTPRAPNSASWHVSTTGSRRAASTSIRSAGTVTATPATGLSSAGTSRST